MAHREDVYLAAISYDTVSTLRDFAREYGIEFDLLSDVGSLVMERLGLLNFQMREERAAWGLELGARHERLPFPGTFLLDEDGVVTDKRFERSHRIRPSGPVLLADLTDEELEPAVSRRASGPGVDLLAWLDEEHYYPGQRQQLHVRLAIGEGIHVYVPPIPKGFVPLEVELLETDGLDAGQPELPEGSPFRVQGFPDEFFVVERTVDLKIPFVFSDDLQRDSSIPLRVRYQACTEELCHPPETLEVELPVRYEPTLRP